MNPSPAPAPITPMAMALLFFFSFSFSFPLSASSAPPPDSVFLLRLKNSISHDPSNLLSSWNLSLNHCTWYGVTCSNFSHKVTVLSLPHCGFSGQIPSDIGGLNFLQVLHLQGNNFSGNIPSQISSLPSLRFLNLSYNSFSGYIPPNLIGNDKLRVIDLSNNMLSGRITIHNSAGCQFLTHLKLSNNSLLDNIPPLIGKCNNLRTLMIDGNILEGQIPAGIGQITELRLLDVSHNCLTGAIPKELANCKKLSLLVLTNLLNFGSNHQEEFNAFEGGIPSELLLLPSLQVLWAPRANLGGRLPAHWTQFCSLRVLNLGQNYFDGTVPLNMGVCKNLTFLDLSSNNLLGYLPRKIQVPCMVYFNVSRNNISGVIPEFGKRSCDTTTRIVSYGQDPSFLDAQDMQIVYANLPLWDSQMGLILGKEFVVIHDLSWNSFIGPLPSFSIGDHFFVNKSKLSYRLLLNNNKLNGSFQEEPVSDCSKLQSVLVNLSANQITGDMQEAWFLHCPQLKEFEAARNQIWGSIDSRIANLVMLQRLDLGGNRLSGSLPHHLGKLKMLEQILLGGNNLTGEIPSELGRLISLRVLDISHNALIGSIPSSLTNAKNLEVVLLDRNRLSGEIPSSFSFLSSLTSLDVSFNNLSGHIPHLQHQIDCTAFGGNRYLSSCSDQHLAAPSKLPIPLQVNNEKHQGKFSPFLTAAVTSAAVVFCIFLVIFLFSIYWRKKWNRFNSLRGKVVVTFADAPTELNYDNVVRATGNFSIRNLIGTGGFGSTYKAELVPAYHIAVKRLSVGRFQGIKQFDAEIRTLGRIRHENLVTLIGYYVGESEMFLIYNYLSGGNLETFIHDKSGKNVQWSVIHKIAINIAQALAYLHYSCVPRIVHRDIKPSNILLDDELNAYLSDFGLARLLEVSETHATTDVAGTFGYVAPEYATTCRVSDKADVYSFGVVLLELMSGKRSLDPSFSEYGDGFNIVEWTKLVIKEGRPSDLFSPELWEAGPRENLLEMLRLASTCTVGTLTVRPSMKQVVEKLKQLRS